MVALKNIRKTENDISDDYYIEGNPEKGFIKINTLNGEVIEHKSVGYGYSHAIYELEQLATLDNPPTEIIVFWCSKNGKTAGSTAIVRRASGSD